MAAGNRKSIGN